MKYYTEVLEKNTETKRKETVDFRVQSVVISNVRQFAFEVLEKKQQQKTQQQRERKPLISVYSLLLLVTYASLLS